jgi:hypothetical protein
MRARFLRRFQRPLSRTKSKCKAKTTARSRKLVEAFWGPHFTPRFWQKSRVSACLASSGLFLYAL